VVVVVRVASGLEHDVDLEGGAIRRRGGVVTVASNPKTERRLRTFFSGPLMMTSPFGPRGSHGERRLTHRRPSPNV
jgi:hypothetical protein